MFKKREKYGKKVVRHKPSLLCGGHRKSSKPHQNLIKKSSKSHPILARNGVFCAKKKREKKVINLPNHTVMEGLVSPQN